MDNRFTTQPRNTKAKSAATRLGVLGHAADNQLATQQFPKTEPFRTSRPFAIAKLALGSFNLVFAIVAFGLLLDLVLKLFFGPYWLNFYLSLPVTSIIWQLAEHITLATRRNWRSICPEAHVGVHLILFALAVSFSCLHSELMFYMNWNWDHAGIMWSLIAFNAMMLISHFTLFAMACVETARKWKLRGEKKRIVYLVVAPGPADGRMYYEPLNQPSQGSRSSVLPPQPGYHSQVFDDSGQT